MRVRVLHTHLSVLLVQTAFMSALACLPLRRLRFLVKALGVDPTPRGILGQPAPPLLDPPLPYNAAECSLRAFDLDGHMRMLVESLPTLTDVDVRIDGLRGTTQKWEMRPEA